MFEKITGKKTLHDLKWWDLIVLTVIMFGSAIYSSTLQYMTPADLSASDNLVTFTTYDNYRALVLQLGMLLIALIYLRLRNFDFTRWKIALSLKTTLFGVILFVFVALMMDVMFFGVWILQSGIQYAGMYFRQGGSLPAIDFSLILYSLFNGVYEEIYFLGMCISVNRKNVKFAFLFSLLIRFSFHTYQGLVSAAGIALILGIAYFLLYEKSDRKNLYPFFLSHAFADILGLSLIQFIR